MQTRTNAHCTPSSPSATGASPPAALHARRWLILAIVSVALLLIVIDVTVLYTALPRLTHELAASASAKLWIMNAYALAVSGLLLGMGTLGDRLGHKRLFVAGLAVFGLASLAAAFSPTAGWLIAARAFLGLGAAMMMPATLSLIRLTFTNEQERAFAIGVWASVASGGMAFGPVVGGALLEHFWWGSVFLINVPIVLIALPLAVYFIPRGGPTSDRPWDPVASLQALVALVGITYAVKESGKQAPDWLAALAALVIGSLFAWRFVRRQLDSADPLLDLSLFRHRAFSAAVAGAMVTAAALIGMELMFSQRLQLVLGQSPLQTGWAILPLPLAAFVAGPLAGHWLSRIGHQRMLPGGLLVAGIGMAAFVLTHSAQQPLWQVGSLVLMGLGMGAAITTASSTIMLSAPEDRAGMAASVEEVSYELGGALGITLSGGLLSAVYTHAMPPLAELSTPGAAPLPSTVRDSLDEALMLAESLGSETGIRRLTDAAFSAFGQAFDVVLAVNTALLCMVAVLAWWSLKSRR
ncbi:MFS transporter [Diaphorobacter ruginosibacter]|uniref:MFS transporter n=1 Tax=Diaphorobacter ruginosibacter TaxID=1715720 RepID=A0A7G9RJZ0_9BURK|nr:MFS transporter [Diaphorobacter ruginosibacter]QNN55915.1 MFS transporter [Diaphorobacter ruginosibacter]